MGSGRWRSNRRRAGATDVEDWAQNRASAAGLREGCARREPGSCSPPAAPTPPRPPPHTVETVTHSSQTPTSHSRDCNKTHHMIRDVYLRQIALDYSSLHWSGAYLPTTIYNIIPVLYEDRLYVMGDTYRYPLILSVIMITIHILFHGPA